MLMLIMIEARQGGIACEKETEKQKYDPSFFCDTYQCVERESSRASAGDFCASNLISIDPHDHHVKRATINSDSYCTAEVFED